MCTKLFNFKLIIACILFITEIIFGLSDNLYRKQKNFIFPDLGEIFQPNENQNEEKNFEKILNRQLVVGRVTRQNPIPQSTCICVPPGRCANSNDSGGPPDGSGVIDIRIVNPSQGTVPMPCQYGLERCCTSGPYQCGMRYIPIPRSSNPALGQAAFGAYPWQAVILTLDDVYLGSGALIDDRHILTAAHKINNLPLNSFKIRLGEWDASNTNEPLPANEYNVVQVFIHPNFNPNNLQNDVAIVRLAPNVDLGEIPTIATVCLPTRYFTGQRCFVSGWGKNDFGPNGNYQAIQQMVDVQIQTQEYCQNSLTRTRLGSRFIFNATSFICAGGEIGKDACTGDGGSPLVCEINNRWYVTGLVAWGIGCATSNVPGVYVNVLTYIPWIQTIITNR